MIKKIIDILMKYFLIILGFIFIVVYLYMNFIRQRLPRDIPYELTEFRFYVLCAICGIYLYVIYRVLYPKSINLLLLRFLKITFKPLIYSTQYIKGLKVISNIYESIWIDFIKKLDNLTWADNILFIYLFTIIPRVLLLFIFVVDVFFVKKIEIFYYFILFGILPLFYILFIKYLETILEEYLRVLEYVYEDVTLYEENYNYMHYKDNPQAIYHGKTVTIRKYLDIIYELFLDNEHDLKYEGSASSKQWHIDVYKNLHKKTIEEFTIEDFDFLEREFNYIMPKLLIIKIFLDYMTNKGQKTAYIPQIKLFILCMYLICWVYILIISIHTLHDLHITYKILEILTLYAEIPDDFSGYSLIFFVFITFRGCSKNFLDKFSKFNKKFIYIIGFAILGLFLLFYYIWFRFIRERLLRDIPCDLTILRFLGLCIICAVYMYIIFRIFVPKKSPGILEFIYPYIRKIYKPFYILDILIRRSFVFKHIYIKVIYDLMVYFKLSYFKHNKYLFILFNIVPKIILLLSLITDIFYCSKLHYFYWALSLSLLPLCYIYTIYLLTQYLHDISNYVDKHFCIKILSTEEEEDAFFENHDTPYFFFSVYLTQNHLNDDGLLDSKKFIYYQAMNIIFDYHLYKYTGIETWFAREIYIKKYKVPRPALWVFEPESDEISKALIVRFKALMPQAYYIKAFIETHNVYVKDDYKKYDIYILVINLICWLYILSVSLHTLDLENILEIIKNTWTIIPNPFTDISMSCIMKH